VCLNISLEAPVQRATKRSQHGRKAGTMEALSEKNILMATQDRCDVKAPIANLLKPECSFMVSNYVHFVKSVGCPDLLYQESFTADV